MRLDRRLGYSFVLDPTVPEIFYFKQMIVSSTLMILVGNTNVSFLFADPLLTSCQRVHQHE